MRLKQITLPHQDCLLLAIHFQSSFKTVLSTLTLVFIKQFSTILEITLNTNDILCNIHKMFLNLRNEVLLLFLFKAQRNTNDQFDFTKIQFVELPLLAQ